MQTCTLRDLVPEGATARVETDPEVARLKSSAADGAGDRAGRPALRGAADAGHGRSRRRGSTCGSAPATGPRRSRRPAGHPAQRGARPDLGGAAHDPGRQARRRGGRRRTCCGGRSAAERRAARRPSTGPGRCSSRPTWSATCGTVPAYLRRCAPWLTPDEVRALQREDPRPGRSPTCRCSTRPGSGSATRRRRGAGAGATAAIAAEREQMDRVVDDILAARRRGGHVMSMLRPGRHPRRARRRGRACPPPTRTCSPVRSRTSSSTRRRS